MQSNEQIAVFLDIENFIGFSNALRLPIDLSEILEKLKEEGRIIIRRSFGDLVNSLNAIDQSRESNKVRRMLQDNLFIHEDIAYQNQFKNSADMRLAVEMLYTAFTVPTITKFALIAGDRDYVPLFQKLQEQNKVVIGIAGSESGTSVIYRRACDRILYFEDILRHPIGELPVEETLTPESLPNTNQQEKPQAPPAAGASVPATVTRVSPGIAAPSLPPQIEVQKTTDKESFAAASFDYQSLQDEYANLLVRAVKVLEQSGTAATIQNLVQQMRQLQSDFNYERAGFDSLQGLIHFAAKQNLVATDQRNNLLTVSLPGSGIISKKTISTAIYRKHIQERIKCQMPTSRIRKMICEKAFTTIGHSIDDGGILLRDLSNDVTDELSADDINIPQPEVYKYLYSLFRNRCFNYEESEHGDYNPFIIGFNAQADDWDDRFILYQIKQLNYDNLPLFTEKLSALFFETEEKTAYIKKMLSRENIKTEN